MQINVSCENSYFLYHNKVIDENILRLFILNLNCKWMKINLIFGGCLHHQLWGMFIFKGLVEQNCVIINMFWSILDKNRHEIS